MSKLTLGIDIGGTKTIVGRLEDGREGPSETLPTTSFEETIKRILEVATRLGGPLGSLSGIGIGCTGPLNEAAGIVLNHDTLDGWVGRNLVKPFVDLFGVPVVLHNDADAALLGELALGSLKEDRSNPSAMFTIGTGIGGAVWLGNRLAYGAYGEHPEYGHMVVDSSGPACYCGISGCLESLVAGPSLLRFARTDGYGTLPEWFDAEATDTSIQRSLSQVRAALTSGVWNIAHTYRPSVVIFGGGIVDAFGDRLIAHLPEVATRMTLLEAPLDIKTATLGNRAGWIGAAWAATSHGKAYSN